MEEKKVPEPPWWKSLEIGTTIWVFEAPTFVGCFEYYGWTLGRYGAIEIVVRLPLKKRPPGEGTRLYLGQEGLCHLTREAAKQAMSDYHFAIFQRNCATRAWLWGGRRVSQAVNREKLLKFLKRHRCPIPKELKRR